MVVELQGVLVMFDVNFSGILSKDLYTDFTLS